jgi:hypothetical protein
VRGGTGSHPKIRTFARVRGGFAVVLLICPDKRPTLPLRALAQVPAFVSAAIQADGPDETAIEALLALAPSPADNRRRLSAGGSSAV